MFKKELPCWEGLEGSENVCVDETFDAWPEQQDFYGITKRISENLLQRSINHNNLHLSILRPSLVYGPNVKGHLNLLIKAAKKHLLPKLPETHNKRSMVHIDDLIQAMLLAINNPAANKQIFIVSDNKEYSTKQIFEHIKNQIPNNTFWAWLSRITIPYCTKAVFPVAGIGSRFLPATKATPKEMLPIVDKPLIQYAVEEAIEAGIEELIFITSYNKRAIEDHFDSNAELERNLENSGKFDLLNTIKNIIPPNVTCIYIRQMQPLGFGHAILCAKKLI